MTETGEANWYGAEVATFGDRLQAAREAAGLKLPELAMRLGVRDTTVHAWEADDWEPRANRMHMLAGMLNVPLVWLMTGEGDGVAPPREGAALVPQAALAEVERLRRKVDNLTRDLMRAEQELSISLRSLAS